ncbi:MAG: small ribosomal subunit Rsm22 family protein [Gammaproteobacteria bacterium]
MTTPIETLLSGLTPTKLREAAETLSQRYRMGESPYLTEDAHYLAYLAMRFPATFEAISRVLEAIAPDEVETFLDLGAGPGTGFLAAQQHFTHIKEATLLETDPAFIKLGKEIIDAPTVTWKRATLPCILPPHDLVLMSYSLGEMDEPEKVLKAAWMATNKFLVIIEPGTPAGYQQIMTIRDTLLSQGAFMVAPCPHALTCPMQGGDWCHFPVRVGRNWLHRFLKSGTLSFEDEKFSYLIMAKTEQALPQARIVGPVNFKKGQVILPLCTTEGQIETTIVTQRTKDLYKQCRKKVWGDRFP